jgi:hypothetical protein
VVPVPMKGNMMRMHRNDQRPRIKALIMWPPMARPAQRSLTSKPRTQLFAACWPSLSATLPSTRELRAAPAATTTAFAVAGLLIVSAELVAIRQGIISTGIILAPVAAGGATALAIGTALVPRLASTKRVARAYARVRLAVILLVMRSAARAPTLRATRSSWRKRASHDHVVRGFLRRRLPSRRSRPEIDDIRTVQDMQTYRLLAAAMLMDTFSIGELAAASGVPLNTARSEFQRKRDFFVTCDDSSSHDGPGRPPRRYRLQDREQVQALLTEAQEAASIRGIVDDPPREPDADQLLTLQLAEHALRRGCLSDDDEDREDLVLTAIKTADRALESLAEFPNREREQRAFAVQAFAHHMRRAFVDGTDEAMGFVANHALTAHSCVPALGAATLLRGLVFLARRAGAAPPIAVVTGPHTRPSDALPGLRSSGWSSRSFSGDLMWTPEWAEDLMERRFLAGVVICDEGRDTQALYRRIDDIDDWRLPTVVACPPDSSETLEQVFAKGVTALPTSSAEAAISWFDRRLTDHTAMGVADVPERTPT